MMVVGIAFYRHGVGEVARELPMQSERQRASTYQGGHGGADKGPNHLF
jgi:hypothetical protein